MNNFLKKYWFKITNRQKYEELKILKQIEDDNFFFKERFEHQINNFHKKIETNQPLNLLHSGHAADIVNILPAIKELSKKHECNLYIRINKSLKYYHKHPAGNIFINTKIYNMLEPLLKSQKYINKVEKFNKQNIDIDFDIYREMPINLLFDNTKYSFHITGLQPDLSLPYIEVHSHDQIKKKIVIQRTFRYRNNFINYKFLNNYENLLFVGTKEEFDDMKLTIKNLEFYDCKDFLEMAEIIKASKFYVGNMGLQYVISDALKVPRLLEASPDSPIHFPIGKDAFDAYHQNHFEKFFANLNKS